MGGGGGGRGGGEEGEKEEGKEMHKYKYLCKPASCHMTSWSTRVKALCQASWEGLYVKVVVPTVPLPQSSLIVEVGAATHAMQWPASRRDTDFSCHHSNRLGRPAAKKKKKKKKKESGMGCSDWHGARHSLWLPKKKKKKKKSPKIYFSDRGLE